MRHARETTEQERDIRDILPKLFTCFNISARYPRSSGGIPSSNAPTDQHGGAGGGGESKKPAGWRQYQEIFIAVLWL
jgi:hypothetical protein